MSGLTLGIVAVNVGLPKPIGIWQGETVLSGIDKRPVASPAVFASRTGITGDGQADPEFHGGPDMAVYAYPQANWGWWETEKQLVCRPGLFGENLTFAGGGESDICIGDRFSWGDAVLEACQPRAPCFKLGLHTGRADVPAAMTASARCGVYFRVLAEGQAPTFGTLNRLSGGTGPTLRECFALAFAGRPDISSLRRIHAAPALAETWRQRLAKKITAAGG